MKAKINPLIGKYCGTILEITASNGDAASLCLWSEGYEPSEREIERHIGCTKEEWQRNDEIYDGMEWGSAKQMHNFVFPHCENMADFELAKLIVGQINANH